MALRANLYRSLMTQGPLGGWLGGLPHAKLLLRTLVALRPLKMQEAVICENMTKLTA